MNLSKLLATRQALLRQTQLANVAYAYVTLRRFAARIETAKLRGAVRLRPANPGDEAFWATLTALEGSQAVLEEHFADHELIELADAMALATDCEFTELRFRIEELGDRYVSALRDVLEAAGVTCDAGNEEADLATGSADQG